MARWLGLVWRGRRCLAAATCTQRRGRHEARPHGVTAPARCSSTCAQPKEHRKGGRLSRERAQAAVAESCSDPTRGAALSAGSLGAPASTWRPCPAKRALVLKLEQDFKTEARRKDSRPEQEERNGIAAPLPATLAIQAHSARGSLRGTGHRWPAGRVKPGLGGHAASSRTGLWCWRALHRGPNGPGGGSGHLA